MHASISGGNRTVPGIRADSVQNCLFVVRVLNSQVHLYICSNVLGAEVWSDIQVVDWPLPCRDNLEKTSHDGQVGLSKHPGTLELAIGYMETG